MIEAAVPAHVEAGEHGLLTSRSWIPLRAVSAPGAGLPGAVLEPHSETGRR